LSGREIEFSFRETCGREIDVSWDFDTGLAAVAPKRRFGAPRRRKSPANPQIGKSALQKRGPQFRYLPLQYFMDSMKLWAEKLSQGNVCQGNRISVLVWHAMIKSISNAAFTGGIFGVIIN